MLTSFLKRLIGVLAGIVVFIGCESSTFAYYKSLKDQDKTDSNLYLAQLYTTYSPSYREQIAKRACKQRKAIGLVVCSKRGSYIKKPLYDENVSDKKNGVKSVKEADLDHDKLDELFQIAHSLYCEKNEASKNNARSDQLCNQLQNANGPNQLASTIQGNFNALNQEYFEGLTDQIDATFSGAPKSGTEQIEYEAKYHRVAKHLEALTTLNRCSGGQNPDLKKLESKFYALTTEFRNPKNNYLNSDKQKLKAGDVLLENKYDAGTIFSGLPSAQREQAKKNAEIQICKNLEAVWKFRLQKFKASVLDLAAAEQTILPSVITDFTGDLKRGFDEAKDRCQIYQQRDGANPEFSNLNFDLNQQELSDELMQIAEEANNHYSSNHPVAPPVQLRSIVQRAGFNNLFAEPILAFGKKKICGWGKVYLDSNVEKTVNELSRLSSITHETPAINSSKVRLRNELSFINAVRQMTPEPGSTCINKRYYELLKETWSGKNAKNPPADPADHLWTKVEFPKLARSVFKVYKDSAFGKSNKKRPDVIIRDTIPARGPHPKVMITYRIKKNGRVKVNYFSPPVVAVDVRRPVLERRPGQSVRAFVSNEFEEETGRAPSEQELRRLIRVHVIAEGLVRDHQRQHRADPSAAKLAEIRDRAQQIYQEESISAPNHRADDDTGEDDEDDDQDDEDQNPDDPLMELYRELFESLNGRAPNSDKEVMQFLRGFSEDGGHSDD